MHGTSGAIQCAMHMVDGLMLGGNGQSRQGLILDNWDQGCAELYEELGSYAELCHQLFEEGFSANGGNAPGVYDYEVSCEFGTWFGNMLESGIIPSKAQAELCLKNLARIFWDRMKEGNK